MLKRRRRIPNKTNRTAGVSVYGINDQIIIEGHAYLPDMGSDSPTACLHLLNATNSDDVEIGSSLLGVLARYDQDEPTSDDQALLKAAGVTSRTRLSRQAAFVSVVQYPERIVFSPWRKHPPGGWTGRLDDPVLEETSGDPARLGSQLRDALRIAEALPRG